MTRYRIIVARDGLAPLEVEVEASSSDAAMEMALGGRGFIDHPIAAGQVLTAFVVFEGRVDGAVVAFRM